MGNFPVVHKTNANEDDLNTLSLNINSIPFSLNTLLVTCFDVTAKITLFTLVVCLKRREDNKSRLFAAKLTERRRKKREEREVNTEKKTARQFL
jgi:hypothetical protein